MRRLFIIRHGKTQWNLAHRLQGAGADSPLLTNDPQPFQQLAGYLDQYAFAAAYTSPLTRAYDTATLTLGYFTRHPAPALQVHSGLRELSFGQWEGRARAELIAQTPELFGQLSRREYSPALAELGVEDFAAARRRFAAACRDILATLGPDENALVFSHGGISQLGMRELTGCEGLLGLKNLSTSIIAATPHGCGVDAYNQTAYLTQVDLNEGNVSI
ncbi:histidine phosphatase family protein [Lacticaseibacillus nasuensis]|uniref:Phosphoglycerate mutase n=2 Tax=Lacticaseibacillus TaxID=2759736 RepID=A0A0R1JTF6_9LACO|nr:histidine phosphatase family protein [Lacticaseibacillus nasuensis]KRK71002.1 phosphoglycerate mutase [Lacticaseibacillus nasuensis JCM 17158]